MRSLLLVAVLGCASFACGGSNPPPATNASSTSSDAGAANSSDTSGSPPISASDAGAATATTATPTADASDAGAAPVADAHPFAKDAAAAESMIDDAIDSRHSQMDKCSADARTRWKEPHAKITFLIGIDQEGSLLGVKRPSKKDKNDEALLACVRAALKGAPFPKSHSGVITIKKTYEETMSTTQTNPNITPN